MSADDTRDPSVPQSFETLGEHYRLQKKLGEGAFGVVYEARHDLLGQDFAVKILKPELCEDENLRERFLDEARALIRFCHTNVVQLRHVGEHEKRLYLVMDLVRGEPLNDLLRREGALAEGRAVDITLQVLAGLEAAHAAGIVHRDLKPSNLIVERHGDRDHVRILDFGLSKLSSIDGMQSAHRSVTGAIIGTLAYMSPEQLAGEKEIDGRSDVFAAGLVLHEMLAGHHPYPGDSGIVVAAKLLRDAVPDLDAKKVAKLSPSTLSALRQSLERDRDARFSSAFAFAQALEGRGPPSDTSRVTTIQDAREALARAEAHAAKSRPKRSKKGLLIAALVVVLGAVGTFLATREGDAPKPDDGKAVARVPDAPPRRTPDPAPSPGTVRPEQPVQPGGSGVAETAPPPPDEPVVTPEPPPDEPTAQPPAVTPEPPAEPVEPPEQPAVAPVAPPEQPAATPALPPETPPEQPAVTPPTPAAATAEDAARLAENGKWLQASAAWRGVLEGRPKDVVALRGAAMTWLAEADAQARRGEISEAQATLDALIAWLTTMYKDVYEPGSVRDRHAMIVPLGFTLTHRGEAHTEKARWCRVQGDTVADQKEMRAAWGDLDLAWQFLDRDGENYWDFLLRRAEWHRLNGDPVKELADLELTTAINSELVPPRMWVAHFNGLRRKAERLLGQRDGTAEKVAREAQLLVRSGESWARRRKENFTREQWLDAARVLFVNHLAWKPEEDRTPLHGLMKWYLEQARAQPARPWVSADLAEARVLPLEAGLALAEAAMLKRRGQADEAAKRQADAVAKAQRAVALREQVAASGERLVAPYPYVVLAQVLHQAGRTAEVQAAMDEARTAAAKNPE